MHRPTELAGVPYFGTGAPTPAYSQRMGTWTARALPAAVLALAASACGDDEPKEEPYEFNGYVIDTSSADYQEGYDTGLGPPSIGHFETHDEAEEACHQLVSYEVIGPSQAKADFAIGCADGYRDGWGGPERD